MSRILVIDDEPTLRISLRYLLEEKGYQVSEAENGNVGIGICRSEHPDLVITDLTMPIRDGVETYQILHREFPHMPIIAVSGQMAPPAIRAAEQAGSFCCLLKPVSPHVLLDRVSEMLSYRSETSDTAS